MEIFGVKVTAPTLPSLGQVRETVNRGVEHAREFGEGAADAARNLGRQGIDLGRRAVADPEGTVRSLAADARKGINDATETARDGISNAVKAHGHAVHAVADRARAAIPGDGLASRVARDAITGVETHVRMKVGLAGGALKGVTSMAGGIGSLAVTSAELNVSPTARAELGNTVAGLAERGGQAVDSYARAVAADPTRIGGDIRDGVGAALDAGGGFIDGQVRAYEAAAARGEGIEHLSMGAGEIASNFIPIGGAARGASMAGHGMDALATGARIVTREGAEGLAAQGGRALVREGGETIAERGTRAATREGGESALRAAGAETRVTTLTATPAAREAAEAAGARLVQSAEAGGGTVRVASHGGVTAQDLAAASRQTGRETALYRDLATGDRYVTIGTPTGAAVPEGSRLIAHVQPGTGAGAVRASVADEAALSRLGQRSSVIIDQSGTAATRFRPTAEGEALARGQAGDVRIHTPNPPPTPLVGGGRLDGSTFRFDTARGQTATTASGSTATIGNAPGYATDATGVRRVLDVDGNPQTIRKPNDSTSQVLNSDNSITYTRNGNSLTFDADGFPVFEQPKADLYLDRSHVNSGDSDGHFRAANGIMSDALRDNPNLRSQLGLTQDQFDFLTKASPSNKSPPDLTWHHHQDTGRMQLVDRGEHQLLSGGHTGGMRIWGGGR